MRSVIHWLAGALWLASTTLLIVGLFRQRLRRAAVLMWCWSTLSVPAVVVLQFLISYGDPGFGCTRG